MKQYESPEVVELGDIEAVTDTWNQSPAGNDHATKWDDDGWDWGWGDGDHDDWDWGWGDDDDDDWGR